jgi:hypothetical protein
VADEDGFLAGKLRQATATVLALSTLAAAILGIINRSEVQHADEQIQAEAADNKRDDDRLDTLSTKVAVLEHFMIQHEPSRTPGGVCVCTVPNGGTRREFEVRFSDLCDANAIAEAKRILPSSAACRAKE